MPQRIFLSDRLSFSVRYLKRCHQFVISIRELINDSSVPVKNLKHRYNSGFTSAGEML